MQGSSLIILHNWQEISQVELAINHVSQTTVCEKQSEKACNICKTCINFIKYPEKYIYELEQLNIEKINFLVRGLDYAVNTFKPVILFKSSNLNNNFSYDEYKLLIIKYGKNGEYPNINK